LVVHNSGVVHWWSQPCLAQASPVSYVSRRCR
jgi:hypothetical protein